METRKSQLYYLERIISSDLFDFIKHQYTVEERLLVDFQKLIKNETERIKGNISLTVIQFNGRKAKRYIRLHQIDLIRLAGVLVTYQPPDKLINGSKKVDISALCQVLYDAIEELLLFVEQHYPKYYYRDAWIPDAYKQIADWMIKRNIHRIGDGLLMFGVDTALIDLATQPLYEFLKGGKRITYGRLIYLKRLKDELQKFTANTDEDVMKAFKYRLYYLNLNTWEVYNYMVNHLKAYSAGMDADQERIGALELVGKELQQAPVKVNWAYNPGVSTLKDQVMSWINQEIGFLKSRQHSSLEHFGGLDPGDDEKNFKLKLDLSVTQLVYLIRVFVEVNIIPKKNITLLIRIITRHTQTKRAENISAESARDKYYKPRNNTPKVVRDLLLKAADHITQKEHL